MKFPSCIEAEKCLLGALLLDGRKAWVKIDGNLTPDDFYEGMNRLVYEKMLQLYQSGEEIDMVGVLSKSSSITTACLTELMDTCITTSMVGYHARIIREKANLRCLVKAGQQIVELALDKQADFDDARQKVLGILQNLEKDGGMDDPAAV